MERKAVTEATIIATMIIKEQPVTEHKSPLPAVLIFKHFILSALDLRYTLLIQGTYYRIEYLFYNNRLCDMYVHACIYYFLNILRKSTFNPTGLALAIEESCFFTLFSSVSSICFMILNRHINPLMNYDCIKLKRSKEIR